MLQPTRHRLVVIQTFIRQIYNRSICMRYAAAGNVLMLKTGYECVSTLTLTHLRSPTSSGWHVTQVLPTCGCNGEWGRWPGPLLTVLDARECHSVIGGQHRADIQIQHATPTPCGPKVCQQTRTFTAGVINWLDYPRRNLRPLGRRGGQSQCELPLPTYSPLTRVVP